MCGIRIKGNGRIADKIPALAINVTALEEDLIQTGGKDGTIRFTIVKRSRPDKYKNDFYLMTSKVELNSNENIALITSREPMLIDVLLHRSFILRKDFQKVKNISGFLKFHLIEVESKISHFRILPGYFNPFGNRLR